MKSILLPVLLLGMVGSLSAQEDSQSLVSRNSEFALDLYQEMAGTRENVFFSPFSISTALAMTYAGARGNTRQEMAEALHFPLDQSILDAEFDQLRSHLQRIQKEGHVRLHMANALWVQSGYQLEPEFKSRNKQFYGADLSSLNFRVDPEDSRFEINQWVEGETEGKIKELLSHGTVNESTRLVLTNAIYFLGEWVNKFDPKRTQKMAFWFAQERKSESSMMVQTATFGYAEDETMQVLEMPYKGRALSMVILLPREIDGLMQLENDLNIQSLTRCILRLNQREVKVIFPKFKMIQGYNLKELLEALGMNDAFSLYADFSGIEPKKELFISIVAHKAHIDVDEAGTEAAASTAVVMMEKVALHDTPIPEFKADHPFLFFIRDKRTGTILFLGKLQNPNRE
jgi:serpin B